MVDLIEQSRIAVDELIDVAGRATIEAVLQLSAEGRSAKEVASLLHISARTAEFHRARAMKALGVRTTAELVQYAYAREGVQLPKVAAQQFDIGIPVSEQHLKPGDAVFFSAPGGYVDHVGLYVGNGRFVTAATDGGGVKLAPIADPPFQGHFVGARRYTAEALSDPGHYARPLPTIKG